MICQAIFLCLSLLDELVSVDEVSVVFVVAEATVKVLDLS